MAESVKKSAVKKRNQTLSSSSFRVSFYNEEITKEIDAYYLEYRTYLLRKTQNRLLLLNKQIKEDNIKKYFVSLKLKYEKLLKLYINLSEEVNHFKTYYELLCEISKKIKEGEKVLKVLKETKFGSLVNTLSGVFNYSLNQLQLVDIDKKVFEDAFRNKIWGSGSEIEVCLKKIEPFLTEHKAGLSKIATEVSEIKKLSLANTMMRERFNSLYDVFCKEVVETNYHLFKGTVQTAFEQREQDKNQDEASILSLNHNFECLLADMKPAASQKLSFSFTNFESSYPVMPNSSSTPQNHNKKL